MIASTRTLLRRYYYLAIGSVRSKEFPIWRKTQAKWVRFPFCKLEEIGIKF